jgi:hypothetical protein
VRHSRSGRREDGLFHRRRGCNGCLSTERSAAAGHHEINAPAAAVRAPPAQLESAACRLGHRRPAPPDPRSGSADSCDTSAGPRHTAPGAPSVGLAARARLPGPAPSATHDKRRLAAASWRGQTAWGFRLANHHGRGSGMPGLFERHGPCRGLVAIGSQPVTS